MQENTVLNAILKERPELRGDIGAAAEILDIMKEAGIEEAELKSGKSRINSRDLWDEVKEHVPYYWHCRTEGEEIMYYVSADNEATPLLNTSSDGFIVSIRSRTQLFANLEELFNDSKLLAEKKSNMSFHEYLKLIHQELRMDPSRGLDQPPELISWDPSVLAFKQFDPGLLRQEAIPTWEEFLKRLDYPDIFLAWIWSVFDPKNMGRQAMWLQGPGGDGKSRVLYAISQIFGHRQTAAVSQDSFGTQFFFSSVYGKKLTMYGDCKNVRLISHSKIHSLLGGDVVAIERKGQDSFSGRVYSRLLVSSNYHPEIDFSMANERSRIIQVEVAPPDKKHSHGDPNFEENLIAEKWGFLYRCKEAYERYCPSGMDLLVPNDMMSKMELRCCSRESELLDQFIDRFLTLDEDSMSIKEDVRQKLVEFFLKHNNRKYDFVQKDLEKRLRNWGVLDAQEIIRGMKRNVWKGVRLKKEDE